MVKRAGRPKFQLDKRNFNHKRRDSIITRIGCPGAAAKWAEAGRAARMMANWNSSPVAETVAGQSAHSTQRLTPNERSRK